MSQSVLSPQHRVGNFGGNPRTPFPGSRGARQALTPAREGGTRVSVPRAGLAVSPLLFDGNDTTGWRFWYAAPGTERHRELSPSRCSRRPEGRSGNAVTSPLPTCAGRPRRGGCVLPWFTVHGPRDWLA